LNVTYFKANVTGRRNAWRGALLLTASSSIFTKLTLVCEVAANQQNLRSICKAAWTAVHLPISRPPVTSVHLTALMSF